jgi:hypothetical protein
MNGENNMPNEIILYSTPQGDKKIEVYFQDENFWLTQKASAQLFCVEIPAISKHLANIYETGELRQEATLSILETVRHEGARSVKRKMEYYSHDAIIAVGYRVNSYQATQFRIWATKTLKEFITKGFVLDDERLKQGKAFGKDYFAELLERIREIRASERRFYRKITDIYALSAFLDLAKNRAERQILMKTEDWVSFLHNFLELSNYPILEDKGKVSALEAKLRAEQEYETYRKIQDDNYISDFDKEIKRIEGRE